MRSFKALAYLFLFSTHAFSQAPTGFQAISKLFNSAQYTKVLSSLENYRPRNKKIRSESYYYKGISYSRLEQYDPAVKALKKAIKLGSTRPDIYYETGQALYGNNDLPEALKFFGTSSKKGFKSAISLYYVAYSCQILEDYKNAKKYYGKMLKDKSATTEYKQIAQYQIAEILLELALKKENTKELVKKHIIPRYEKAYQISKKSRLAKDIKTRKLEVIRRYHLDPNQLISGKNFPKKRHRITFSQSYKYDNNITLTTNQPNVQDTKKDSYIYETKTDASYAFLFKQMYIITPGIKFKYTKHSDRESPEIYEDDRYEIKPTLNQRLDHKVFKKAASVTLDYNWSYSARDHFRIKKLRKYSTGTNWTIGEKIRIFRFGDTGISYSWGDTAYYDSSLNYDLTSWTLTQSVIRPSGNLFLLMMNKTSSRFPKASTSDSDTTMYRIDYIVPKFAGQYSFHFGFSITNLVTLATETSGSNPTGTEKTYSPSMKLSKAVRDNVKLSVNYDYSRKISDAGENNEYTKHVTGFEISASF